MSYKNVSFIDQMTFRKASPTEIREEYERLQREKVMTLILLSYSIMQ